MEENDFRFIQDQIGYNFKNKDLLQQAFVRRSYAKENGGEDNEVLEFIGDKVLDFIVVKLLVEKYGYFLSDCDDFNQNEEYDEFCTEYHENKLTEIKKKLVGKKTLARKMDALGLANYLIMGNGDIRNKVHEQESVKEDLFEAILGAVALDSEWNLSELQDVVEIMLVPDSELAENSDPDYVGLIQEWCCKKNGTIPIYHFKEASCQSTAYASYPGQLLVSRNIDSFDRTSFQPVVYASCHNHLLASGNISGFSNKRMNEMQFSCILEIDDDLQEFKGFGNSKSEARKTACKKAYEYLEKQNLILSIKTEIDNPNRSEAINQLEILARRGYFSIPTYKFTQDYAKNGNPIWKCECCIKEEAKSFWAKDSLKKEAKKSAAFKMLEYVLEDN